MIWSCKEYYNIMTSLIFFFVELCNFANYSFQHYLFLNNFLSQSLAVFLILNNYSHIIMIAVYFIFNNNNTHITRLATSAVSIILTLIEINNCWLHFQSYTYFSHFYIISLNIFFINIFYTVSTVSFLIFIINNIILIIFIISIILILW